MTVFAGDLCNRVDGVVVGQQLALDDMIVCLVAIGAKEVEPAHVNVQVLRREIEALVQVAVLDAVAAAAVEMALAAFLACRRPHRLSGGQQVNAFSRQAVVALVIDRRIGMAGQAVHVGLLGEIEVLVRPAVTDVASHALLFIALRTDAEVVDLILFANRHRLIAPGNRDRIAFPGPVRGVHDLVGRVSVALEAGRGHFLPAVERSLDDVAVVGVNRLCGDVRPWIRVAIRHGASVGRRCTGCQHQNQRK